MQLNLHTHYVSLLVLVSSSVWLIKCGQFFCSMLCSSCSSYLSGLIGAHEEGMSHEAFRQSPAAANTGAAVRRLAAGVADDRAAPQVVLVVATARAVSSLQGATEKLTNWNNGRCSQLYCIRRTLPSRHLHRRGRGCVSPSLSPFPDGEQSN